MVLEKTKVVAFKNNQNKEKSKWNANKKKYSRLFRMLTPGKTFNASVPGCDKRIFNA